MQLYGLKTCETCRKAMKALPEAVFVDVREAGVPDDLLEKALESFGDALLNTKSTTWRQLDATERQKPPLVLLRSHPTLMKRPLIRSGETLHLGWSDDVRAALGVA